MRVLHTAVSDHIRKIERTDPERAAEMRAGADGNDEYAREVRGDFDYDYDPADDDEDGRHDTDEESED